MQKEALPVQLGRSSQIYCLARPVRRLLNVDILCVQLPCTTNAGPSRASAWCALSDKHADAVQGRLLHHLVLTILLVAQVHHRRMEDIVDISMDSPEGMHNPLSQHTATVSSCTAQFAEFFTTGSTYEWSVFWVMSFCR